MKFFTILVCLTIFVASSVANLKGDLEELLDLIPQKEIIEIGMKYYLYDDEFKDLVRYTKSPEFVRAWYELMNHQEVKKLINYLEMNDIDTMKVSNEIADLCGKIEVPKNSVKIPHDGRISGGVTGFIKDVEAVLPMNVILSFVDEKMKNSRSVRGLHNTIADINADAIRGFIQNSKELSHYLDKIKSYGVDVARYTKNFNLYFGWH